MDMTQSRLKMTQVDRKHVNVLFQLDEPSHRKAKIDAFQRGETFRQWLVAAVKARIDEQEGLPPSAN